MRCVKCGSECLVRSGGFDPLSVGGKWMCHTCAEMIITSLPTDHNGVPVAAGPCEVWLPKGAKDMEDWEIFDGEGPYKVTAFNVCDDNVLAFLNVDESDFYDGPWFASREAAEAYEADKRVN